MEQSNAPVAGTRPTFLTVLCILTWVGCAIGLVMYVVGGAFVGAVSASKDAIVSNTNAAMDSAGVTMSDAASADMNKANAAADSAIHAASTVMIIGIISVLLCLVGSIMMWKLKKMGFYLYALGEIAVPVASIVLIGSSAMAGGMGIFSMAVAPVVMLVLYGLNLKHMK